MLQEGGAGIGGVANDGRTALLTAAEYGKLANAQYLLEHGGADIWDTLEAGDTIWALLAENLIEGGRDPEDHEDDNLPYVYDATVVTSLLRVMVLQDVPPAELTAPVPRGRALPADSAASCLNLRLRGAHEHV